MPTHKALSKQTLTLPNLLSVLRIMMIPPIVHSFLKGHLWLCGLLIVLSGVTDVADGWIARRFSMVSNLGKVLDPIADKLTLAAILALLTTVHPGVMPLFVILILREAVMAATGLACVMQTGMCHSARWHGKASTAVLYASGLIHILWQEIPAAASYILIVLCAVLQLFSLALYTMDNLRCILRARGGI